MPGGDADVDPFVHASPAHAEPARHRPVHRPDEPGCRGRGVPGRRVGVAGLGRLDLAGKRGAGLRKACGLVEVFLLALGHVPEAFPLRRARGGETVLAREELVPQRPHLARAKGDRPRLGSRERAEALRVLPLPAHSLLGRSHLAGDVPVLRHDRVHVVGLRDQVGEGLGRGSTSSELGSPPS